MNATKLQHIHFLGNCVSELFGVDLPAAYQHAFVFIRQLAMILRDALTMKTKVTISFSLYFGRAHVFSFIPGCSESVLNYVVGLFIVIVQRLK